MLQRARGPSGSIAAPMRSPHCRLRPSQAAPEGANWCPHCAKTIKTPLRSAEKRIDGQRRYRAKRGRFRLKASNTSPRLNRQTHGNCPIFLFYRREVFGSSGLPTWGFDFDHIGPEVAKKLAAELASFIRELDDPQGRPAGPAEAGRRSLEHLLHLGKARPFCRPQSCISLSTRLSCRCSPNRRTLCRMARGGSSSRSGMASGRWFFVMRTSAANETACTRNTLYIRLHFPGWQPERQTLLNEGRAYDSIELTGPDGAKRTIFFDISGWFGK